MSEEELRIRIAKLLGWTSVVEYAGQAILGTSPDLERHTIPNYCNDLNAMHEAETWFMQHHQLPRWNDYVSAIVDICGHNNPEPYRIKTVADFYCYAFHATARQRAEAFVKVMEVK